MVGRTIASAILRTMPFRRELLSDSLPLLLPSVLPEYRTTGTGGGLSANFPLPHYGRIARQPSRTGDERSWTALFVPLPRFCNHECGRRSYGTHSELQGCDKISTVTRARDFSALRF